MPYGFDSDIAWRSAAMLRPDGVDSAEAEARRRQAEAHNVEHGISDPDQLLDQQLYISGKMDMQEYQAYLLFKHSNTA